MVSRIKAGALGVSLAILVLMVLYSNPQRFVSLLASSNKYFLFIAFFLSNVNIVMRVLKWKMLLPKIRLKHLGPAQLIGITASNLSPGKVAEPLKSVVLKTYTGTPVSATLPSVIWERILDILSVIILSLVGLFIFIRISGDLFIISVISLLIFLVLVIAGLLVLYKKSFRDRVFKIARKLPVARNISEKFVETFGESLIEKKNIAFSFVITLAVWLIEGVILHFVFLSLDVNIDFLILASIFALATLIGVITTLPGGIGPTEIILALFLGFLGVENSVAIAGVLLSRFLVIWYFNFLGGACMVYLAKRLKLSYSSIFG